jgi:preprotein translocase subunit SecB
MMQGKFKHHPIQLREITVHKLNVTVNDPLVARDYEGEVSLKLEIGRSEFTEGDPNISVGLRVLADPISTSETTGEGEQEEDEVLPAFSVEVELLGHFIVDYSKFKFEHLTSWAKINAPFLLLPFVREHVYSLAIHAGIKGLVLPLFVQPGSGPKAGQPEIAPDNP